ncbi:MAG: hypothetical protein Q9225_001414 [Loekoesia sp. 1 TL-2023]
MPRPKRTKVAPSDPIAIPTIAAEKRKTDLEPLSASESVSSSRGTNGSDDSEGIITTNKAGVNHRGVAPQIATMSGALAVEDVGEKRLKPLSSRRRVALSRIAREADHAKAIEALKARRDAALAAEKLAKEGIQVEVQIQSAQTAKAPVATRVLPVAPSHAPMTSNQGSRLTQAAETRATPSRETSILDIENFKRRPRQPSLLQIAQAQNAAEESEIDDTLDDFNPDDESTPLHQSNPGLQLDPLSTSSGHQSSSRKRKLSTPEIQVPASQPQNVPDRSSSPVPSSSDNLLGTPAEDSQPNPPLPAIPPEKSTSAQQTIYSDTLAPPRSSSPPDSPKTQPCQSKTRSRKSQGASKANGKAANSKVRKPLGPVLPPRSPSPTQRSPTNASTTRSPLKPLTTSALQNLLPRRRRIMSRNKENNIFELNSSSDMDSFNAGEMDEGADELSYHITSRKSAPEKSKNTRKGKGGGTSIATKSKPKKGEKRPGMTYTRKQNLDPDEDEDAGSGSGNQDVAGAVTMDGKAREEMKKLAAKFREVDDWGLEFEEVTGSSDRMRDAR